MKDFKNLWAAKAQTKTITSTDMAALCILRAVKAKSENKSLIANYFIGQAFSPKGGWNYSAARSAIRAVDSNLRWGDKVLGLPSSDIFDTEEEKQLFVATVKELFNYDGREHDGGSNG